MTFQSTVTVEFGDKVGLSDISDRVQGAQIVTRVNTGDFGTNRALITLRNDDGAFTPGAGGTYDGVDWFAQGLFISGDTGSNTYTLFHGLITSFDLNDNGTNSTVVIEADDALTVGGSSATTFNINFAFASQIYQWLELAYNGYSTLATGVPMPLLANTTSSVDANNIGIDTLATSAIGTDDYAATYPARDFIRTVIMPSSPNVCWPTTIDLTTTDTVYNASVTSTYPVRGSGTSITFTFDESASTGELPFHNLKRGFTTDDLINTTYMTTLPQPTTGSPITETASNQTSVEKYGAKAIQLTSVMTSYPGDDSAFEPTVVASRWANVFSGSEFVVRTFEVTEALVRSVVGTSSTSEEKWAQLLDIETGPIQVGTITFTPAGGSTAITESFVTMSRTIQITPADIRLTVECLPIDQTGAFVLDSSTLGVLDQNRLG